MPGVQFVDEGVTYPGDPYYFTPSSDHPFYLYVLFVAVPLLFIRFCVLCVRLYRLR